jgi:glycosyltransferase involved in cell wall biosynthesis
MSNWAAASLSRQGIPAERIHVIHPGLNLDFWSPGRRIRADDAPARLLFVGADFVRKGGELLLRVFDEQFASRCKLDIVTRDPVRPSPGVRVHQDLKPNSVELRDLYRNADLFVLPTTADCFGHVAVEAMACGVPVVMTNVGGAADIVVPGKTGWLLDDPAELAEVLEDALSSAPRLREFGANARSRAEKLFNGCANDRRLADLLIELAARPH